MAKTPITSTPWDNIQASENRLTDLRSRVTDDRNRFMATTPFVMTGKNGKTMKSVYNITSNDPIVFAIKCMSFLGAATRQIVVEGVELADKKSNPIEEVLKYAFDDADKRLAKKGLLPLHNSLAAYACLDGWIGASAVISYEAGVKGKGNPVFDILPLDILNFNYDAGGKGLIYAAPKYTRSKAQILDEYGDVMPAGIAIPDEGGVIHNYSDKDITAILFQKTGADKADTILEAPNPLGKPLAALQPVSMTPMLNDKLANFGESIYQANRALYDTKNMIESILMTLVVQSFKAPLQLRTNKSVQGQDGAKLRENLQAAYDAGSILVIGENDQAALLPTRDIAASAPMLLNIIEGEIQRGGLPNIDFGNLTFPLSAVAITSLSGSKDTIFLPRFQAMAMLYREICSLIQDQFVAGSYVLKLDNSDGKKDSYTKATFAGNFTVNFQFSAVSPEQQLANMSAARTAMASGCYSKKTVISDILKIDNVEAELDEIEKEETESLVPETKIYHTAKRLIENAQKLDTDGKLAATAEAALLLRKIGFSSADIKTQTGIDFGTTAPQMPTGANSPMPGAVTQDQTQGNADMGLGAAMPTMPAESAGTMLNQMAQGKGAQKKPAKAGK